MRHSRGVHEVRYVSVYSTPPSSGLARVSRARREVLAGGTGRFQLGDPWVTPPVFIPSLRTETYTQALVVTKMPEAAGCLCHLHEVNDACVRVPVGRGSLRGVSWRGTLVP